MPNNKISGLGFHHIALKVSEFEKSLKFYRDGLGMSELVTWGENNERIQMLDLGDGGILELFAGGSSDETQNAKWIHFAMKVDDTDKAYETAVAAGGVPLTPPKTVDLNSKPNKMSIRIAFVRGFDGEELEFFKVL